MEKRKLDWLLILHFMILLWAILFFYSLHLLDRGQLAGMLAPGIFAGLFLSIPLAVFSLIAKVKNRFSEKLSVPVTVLSILNIGVGIAAWTFAIMVFLKP